MNKSLDFIFKCMRCGDYFLCDFRCEVVEDTSIHCVCNNCRVLDKTDKRFRKCNTKPITVEEAIALLL